MAKMKMYGTEEYALKLSKLAANSKEVAERKRSRRPPAL